MADIIQIEHYRPRNPGNGALPIVRQYFDCLPLPQLNTQLPAGDRFLTWLWDNGFVVTPLEQRQKPNLQAEREVVSGVVIPPADDDRLDDANR